MKHQASWIAVALVVVSSPGMAQDTARAEVGIGYAYGSGAYESHFPLGGYADVVFPRSHWIGPVAEVTVGYDTRVGTYDGQRFETKRYRQTFLVGPRFARRGDRLGLHLQVLAGILRERVSSSGFPAASWANAGLLQPGVGVEARLSDRFALRLGGDVLLVVAEAGSTEWRTTGGLAYRFGHK